MRKLVHREVAHIRSMAGLEIPTSSSKDLKDLDNEAQALDGLESDRLQLKDLTGPEALKGLESDTGPMPVLPDKYLEPSANERGSDSSSEETPSESLLQSSSVVDAPGDQTWAKLDKKFEK